MKDLKEIIKWVEQKATNTLEVFDATKQKEIEHYLNKDLARETSDSVEGWFLDQANNGVTQVTVIRKVRNGSSYHSRTCPLTFNISDKNNQSQPVGNATSPAAMPAASVPSPGLAGGLSFPDMVRMGAAETLLVKAESENRELKQENKELKAENERLKDEQRDEKASNNRIEGYAKIAEGLAPALMGILSKAQGGNPGLNAPADNLPGHLKSLIDYIDANASLIDAQMASSIYYIISLALSGNEKFIEEINKVIAKYTQNNAA